MNTNFATILKKLRTEKKLSQAALAKAINVTRTSISRWESNKGKPKIIFLVELADFFEVTIHYLCYGKEKL